MSGRSVNLNTLFLGRLRLPARLTSTSCTCFRHSLTTALLESAEGGTIVCGQNGYLTQDLLLTSQVPTDCATWSGLETDGTLFFLPIIIYHSSYLSFLDILRHSAFLRGGAKVTWNLEF